MQEERLLERKQRKSTSSRAWADFGGYCATDHCFSDCWADKNKSWGSSLSNPSLKSLSASPCGGSHEPTEHPESARAAWQCWLGSHLPSGCPPLAELEGQESSCPPLLCFTQVDLRSFLCSQFPRSNNCTEQTSAESRRGAKTQQILEGHDSGRETALSWPDFSHGFSLAPQQRDCPTYTEQHIEIHMVLYNVNGSSKAHLQEHSNPSKQEGMLCSLQRTVL